MQTRTESSVLFNLQELMRIEHDRVLTEEAAERAAVLAVQRQREDRQRQQVLALERERCAQLAIETDRREAEQLGAQVEIERARLVHQRLEMELAQAQLSAPRPIEVATPDRGVSLRQMFLVLGATLLIAALGYFGWVEPLLQQSR